MRRVVLISLAALALAGCVLKSPPPSTIGAAAGGGSAYGGAYGDAYADNPYAADPLQPPGDQGIDPERSGPLASTFVPPAGWTTTALAGSETSASGSRATLAVATYLAVGNRPASQVLFTHDGLHWQNGPGATTGCGGRCPAEPALLATDSAGDIVGIASGGDSAGASRAMRITATGQSSVPTNAGAVDLVVGSHYVGYDDGGTIVSGDGVTWRPLLHAKPEPAGLKATTLCAHRDQTLALGQYDVPSYLLDTGATGWNRLQVQPLSLRSDLDAGTLVLRCDQHVPALLALSGTSAPTVWSSEDLSTSWHPLGTLGLDTGDTVVDVVHAGGYLLALAKRGLQCVVEVAKADGEKLGTPPTIFAGPCLPKSIQVIDRNVVVLLDDTGGNRTDAATAPLASVLQHG